MRYQTGTQCRDFLGTLLDSGKCREHRKLLHRKRLYDMDHEAFVQPVLDRQTSVKTSPSVRALSNVVQLTQILYLHAALVRVPCETLTTLTVTI